MPQVDGADAGTWDDMLASVRSRRHRDARHLKPACLHVVADGLDGDDLDPDDIDAGFVIERLASLLGLAALPVPSRLWRPLWHLTNDGAWDFVGSAGRVGPEDFGSGRKPESLAAIGARAERIQVSDHLRAMWLSPDGREVLRDRVIDMLAEGDAASRAVAEVLGRSMASSAPAGVQPPSGAAGQGRIADTAVRSVVELHAMSRVGAHLAAEGWTCEDVSATESHDLLCTKGSERLLVEVKGTTGLGRKVQLTANEVALAQREARTALAIVACIELGEDGPGLVAHGGSVRVIDPWTPLASDLRPISYEYSVPAA